ncbi:hypothetical protein V6Z11_A08G052700, partial [Gossypium hirsutum]
MEAKSLWVLFTTLVFIIQGWRQTEGCLEQERIALFQLKSFFNRPYKLERCNITNKRVIGLDLYFTRYWDNRGWRSDLSEYLNVSLFLPFEELKSLNLSENNIADLVDNQVSLSSVFNNLEILDLSGNNFNDSVLSKLKSLTNLKTLDISNNMIVSLYHFEGEKVQPMMNLEVLDLSSNLLKNNDLTYLKGLSSLKSFSIRRNQLEGSISIRVLNNLTKLKQLDLSGNKIESLQSSHDGERPINLTNLEELYLDSNSFTNSLLAQLSGFSNLKSLNIRNNQLKGSINIKGWCDLWKLEVLDLSENALKGTLPPCLANLSSLDYLDISDNQFTGKGASTALANLTLLRFISLSQNLFEVPSIFISFANHSHLKFLFSDQNKLVKEPTIQTWVPKFQLKVFRLWNCATKVLHIEIPKFLYYQNDLSFIDLSDNNFGGNPFWLLENNTRMRAFLIEGNSFMGHFNIPSHPNPNMSIVDISNNKIQGPIPANICSIFPQLARLNLSSNSLQGNIPPCLVSLNTMLMIDMSHNQLYGGIPEMLAQSDSLMFLRLSNNHLSGKITPTIFCSPSLKFLYLDGNKFDGNIPSIDISTFPYYSLSDIDL